MAPIELFTKYKLSCSLVWLSYGIRSQAQRWEAYRTLKSRTSQFLAIDLIQITTTGSVAPRFHAVYNDLFTTVSYLVYTPFTQVFAELFTFLLLLKLP